MNRVNEFRLKLREYQRARLPELRMEAPSISRYEGEVTLIAYTFPKDENDFDFIEFAIRQSWHCLGKLKAVIIADRMTERLDAFAKANSEVEIQLEPSLKVGDILTMTDDCIERLYTRFTTSYCLIVQDDGFPLSDRLSEFLGKYDYIGAPIISDGWKRKLGYAIGMGAFNGGFSLRTKRFCEYAQRMWKKVFSKIWSEKRFPFGEDVYYTTLLKFLPSTWFKFRFPNEREAFEFAVDCLGGHVRPPETARPFGVHGPMSIDWAQTKGLLDG